MKLLQVLILLVVLTTCFTDCTSATQPPLDGQRRVTVLNDDWLLERNGRSSRVDLSDSWEAKGFEDFNGLGTYRKSLAPVDLGPTVQLTESIPERRWLLQIDAAATASTVRVNGDILAKHLGGWTPFRVDVTEQVSDLSMGRSLDLEIEVDELVGHNTQGFLPIVVPHFGGIWKSVRLIHTGGSVYLDDMTVKLSGFEGADAIDFAVQLRGETRQVDEELSVGVRIIGPSSQVATDWQWFEVQTPDSFFSVPAAGTDQRVGISIGRIVPPVIKRWSPGQPFLYQVELALKNESGRIIDRFIEQAAIRHFRTDGQRLLINEEPINVRGLLNWGYAPPRLAPTLSEKQIRAELEFARQRGFNLMKFCLWTPPKKYLKLADELGMLTWIEYPTWHPDFSSQHLQDLRREFTELFYYDRNSASVLLRSLTCETGHGASEGVIRELYDLGHRLIPGAIIEDDSSWIGWHRVHDFYDDHPYGNNHAWPAKLRELQEHIDQREKMPLVLGEAIAADTWERPSGTEGPHESLSAPEFEQYRSQTLRRHALANDESIRAASYAVALAMRKYQIEAFRWLLPDAGYVVSVIRDFPKASMGLIDRDGQSKWRVADFAWHSDIQLSLEDGIATRCFSNGTQQIAINVSSDVGLGESLELVVTLDGHPLEVLASNDAISDDALIGLKKNPRRDDQARFLVQLEPSKVTRPRKSELRATLLRGSKTIATNRWGIWRVPQPRLPSQLVSRLWADRMALNDVTLASLGIAPQAIAGAAEQIDLETLDAENPPLILTTHLDEPTLQAIEAGAGCVLLADGGPGSPPLREHWFLRGGPIVANHPVVERLGREFLVELQTFDLAGSVLFDFPMLDQGTPIFSLWDNHDLDTYRTHSLLWEAAIGRGSLLISALPWEPLGNDSRGFVVSQLLQHVSDGFPAKQFMQSDVQRLYTELNLRSRSLVDSRWEFRLATSSEAAELAKQGQADDALETLSDQEASSGWKEIQITSHWDGQGYGDLDGWGLYRTQVEIPDDWPEDGVHLNFTGVDDYYRVFVDGVLVGSGGDIENRVTAFELRKSHLLPQPVCADKRLGITVAVFDWYGAGGIFRPVTISTQPLPPGQPWLLAPGNE